MRQHGGDGPDSEKEAGDGERERIRQVAVCMCRPAKESAGPKPPSASSDGGGAAPSETESGDSMSDILLLLPDTWLARYKASSLPAGASNPMQAAIVEHLGALEIDEETDKTPLPGDTDFQHACGFE